MVGQRSMEQREGREFNGEVVIVRRFSTFVVELWTGPDCDAGLGTKCGYFWFVLVIGTDYGYISQLICVTDHVLEHCILIDAGITDVICGVIDTGLASYVNGFVGTGLDISGDIVFCITNRLVGAHVLCGFIRQPHRTDRR